MLELTQIFFFFLKCHRACPFYPPRPPPLTTSPICEGRDLPVFEHASRLVGGATRLSKGSVLTCKYDKYPPQIGNLTFSQTRQKVVRGERGSDVWVHVWARRLNEGSASVLLNPIHLT